LVPNNSTSLEKTIATEVPLEESQCLLEEQILNIENSLTYRARTQRTTASRRGPNLDTKQN
jgi:hypothetical protein